MQNTPLCLVGQIHVAASCRLGLNRSVSHQLYQRVNHFCSSEQSDLSRVVVDWSHFHYIENVSKRFCSTRPKRQLKTYQRQLQ
jgi:hypothetical protein